MSLLPDYIVADVYNMEETDDTEIRRKAIQINFPLNKEDESDIKMLIKKFDSEKKEKIAGLAAPQLGISKRVFIFAVPKEVAKVKKCQAFPKSVWINPSYERARDEMEEEYEHCFSVKDFVGPVMRYKSIHYKAQDMAGKAIEGIADGYTARVIQHETDHLNGRLFVDLVPKENLITYDEYIQRQVLLNRWEREQYG